MALTIRGAMSKIGHAQHHLETLKTELETWVNGRPYLITRDEKADAETRTFNFYLGEIFEAPDALGLVFGDYIHSLRSALDHVVWALVVNNKGGKEPKNANEISFPVAGNRAQFYDAPVLRHLTWEQATLLEHFQPYHGGDAADALASLNRFWNDDKHRLVLPVLARIERMPPYSFEDVGSVVGDWFEPDKPLKPGTKIAWVQVAPSGPNPQVNVESIPVEVAFGKSPRLRHADVPKLRDVAQAIVLSFRAFFS